MRKIFDKWDKDIIEIINQFEYVYLYGAGNWGRRVYVWCQRNNIAIKGVIVSNETEEKNFFETYIYSLAKIREKLIGDENLILIASYGKNGTEIYNLCLEMNLHNIMLPLVLPKDVDGGEYYKQLRPNEYRYALESEYTLEEYRIDLSHPITFNEKIQWLKLYGNHQQMARLADKYLVRDYVISKVGEEHLVKLLKVWESPEEICINDLPKQFAIKCNHGCGYNIIVRDRDLLDLELVRRQIRQWMAEDYSKKGAFELHYGLIAHKIICEEYIEQFDGGLNDYKIHCFGGKAMFIQLIGERDIEKHTAKQLVFDRNWNLLDWSFGDYPKISHIIERPCCLDELLEVAEKLATGIEYVRVDLYVINDVVKFGEMTFTPGGGYYSYNHDWSREANIMLGNLMVLPT